jgi:hypothetical protein
MFPNSPVVKAVYLDPQAGIIAGVEAAAKASPEEKFIIECGTIETATTPEVPRQLLRVFKSVHQREARYLLLMCQSLEVLWVLKMGR